ncbi:MAG: MFS transporter [Gaiellales bacterium]
MNRSRARTTLVMAIAAQAAVSVLQFAFPAVGGDVRQELHVGPAAFGALFAALGFGSAIALIPTGMLVDRLGARPVLLAGAVLTGAGDLTAAWVRSVPLFALCLLVAGIGTAAVPVAGMSALLREFPPERRGVALGWRQLAVPLGGTAGAVLLPALASLGGIRLVLIAAAAITVSTSAAFARFTGREARGTGRLGLDGVLTLRWMRPLLAIGLLYACSLGATITYIVPAARSAGMGRSAAAALFVLVNVTAAAARLAWGRMADRHGGSRRIRTLADTGAIAAAGALLVGPALDAGPAAAAAATALLAFGTFGFNGVLYVAAGELAGAERAGRAVGVASTVVFGAAALAAPLAGSVVQLGGYPAMWIVAAVTAAAGSALALRMSAVRTDASLGALVSPP